MKILVPVDASEAALAPISYLEELARSGVKLEVLLMNVQPRFHRHVCQFTSRAARVACAPSAAAAMARAIEQLSVRNIPFRVFAEVGQPAERIAVVAEREQVDEVMMGVGRHPVAALAEPFDRAGGDGAHRHPGDRPRARHAGAFERYAVPAGVAGLAALLLAVE